MQKEWNLYLIPKPRYKLAVFRLRVEDRNRAPRRACCLPLSSEWNFPRREIRRPRPRYRYLEVRSSVFDSSSRVYTRRNLTIFLLIRSLHFQSTRLKAQQLSVPRYQILSQDQQWSAMQKYKISLNAQWYFDKRYFTRASCEQKPIHSSRNGRKHAICTFNQIFKYYYRISKLYLSYNSLYISLCYYTYYIRLFCNTNSVSC